jgi:hypothetical protein
MSPAKNREQFLEAVAGLLARAERASETPLGFDASNDPRRVVLEQKARAFRFWGRRRDQVEALLERFALERYEHPAAPRDSRRT